MSKTGKILLGIITFLPLFFGICLFVDYIFVIMNLVSSLPQNNDPQLFFSHVFSGQLLTLGILTFVTHIGLMIYYIVHVVTHKVKSDAEKVMWLLLFVFIGTIAFIIYYFIRIVSMPAKQEVEPLNY